MALLGPAFVNVIVNTTLSPTFGALLSTVKAILKSASLSIVMVTVAVFETEVGVFVTWYSIVTSVPASAKVGV